MPNMQPITDILKEAADTGILITADGEIISDLVPQPETHAQVWARFHGQQVSADAEDLVPKPETPETVWARFHGRLKTGKGA